jgi:D-alanyl-D-alanine carboxypeptidase
MGRLPLALAAVCFLLAGVSAGEAKQAAGAVKKPAADAQPVAAVPAQPAAYIVVDADSGMVLGQRDSDKVWYPASVTKLMTAYLTFQALKTGRLKLTSPVIETANALAEPPSKMGFAAGTSMSVDNALKMMLVHSANDIAVAVAETVGGGSEARFVAQMNAAARSLGMSSTHYDNPNGLPSPGQLTTARDLAVLARTILHEFPEYKDYFRIPAIKAGRRILRSQNALLDRYPGATGMKTGFICDSGFNMVASATHGGRTLIAVVLGAPTALGRAELAAKLLNVGFSGGSFGFARTELASFHAGASPGPAVNLHDAVCGRHRSHPADEDADVGDVGSALGPPIASMPPVVVYTGEPDPGKVAKVDATTGVSVDLTAVQAKKTRVVPLPRLRPAHIPAAAAKPAKAIVLQASPTVQ